MSGEAPIEAIASVFRDASGPVVIASHVNPDGDAIGSTLAMRSILAAMGIDAVVRLADDEAAPSAYRFLPGWENLLPFSPHDEAEVFVALDSTDISRLGRGRELAESARQLVVIDHHPDNSGFGHLAWVDPSAPAVGVMLWEALPDLGVAADGEIATCTYTALLTDTGRFTHDNTDARALRIAAEMVDAGADPATIARFVYQSRSAAALALTGLVLGRLELANDGQVAFSWFDADDLESSGATLADAEDLVDQVRLIEGPQVAVLAKVLDGETRLSLRAKGSFDVGDVARRLGGGGHRAAAGASVQGGLANALDAMLPLLPGGDS